MANNRNTSQSKIAAAVTLSLWVFAGLAVLLGSSLWFLNRSPKEANILEAKVTVPAPQTHIQHPPYVLFTISRLKLALILCTTMERTENA